ncbi:13838_t:CDS:2 [Gigaspora margarita]|uniref:13838_t:CDS:1 n=1 Tax=Gigaspora margarita TaxID=4874 RepID=A0ABN7V7F9_GIGMA|nr:13838_t:CDS:2 [Gigaspora margarita]
MEKDDELSANLIDPYDVLFFSRTQVSLVDEVFENGDDDSSIEIAKLANEIDTINLNSEEIEFNTARSLQVNKEKIRGREHRSRKGENNIVSERKAQISARLPIPPNFNYLKHNILFYQGRTLAHREFRLQLAWDFINDTLSTKRPTANKQYVTENWASIVIKNLKLPTIHHSGSNYYPE